MKVFLTQNISKVGKDYLTERGYELVLASAGDEDTLSREIGDADAMVVRTQKITERILDSAPNLKVIGVHGIGTDNVDLEAARKRNIRVTNGPESNFESVAEHIVALIFAIGHSVTYLDNAVRTGNWESRNNIMLNELYGRTFGVIGYGRIGSRTAEILHTAFNMNIIAWSRSLHTRKVPDYVTVADSVDQLLEESDIVSLCCPANEDSRSMINARRLALMKPTAYLINCGRGVLVDEEALYDALTNGVIRGAGIDCYVEEPPKLDNPLLGLSNVIFSPHCASHTPESMDRMALHAAIGVDEVLTGKPVTWPVV
jgi:D-3-phosphoglycerate dehydrogenase